MTISNKLPTLALGILMGSLGTYWLLSGNQSLPTTSPIRTTTALSVTTKESADDPDLVVSQKYVATINNKKVEVPISNVSTGNTTSAAETSAAPHTGATPFVATLQQEVDITPLVAYMVPKWELGIGIGRHKENTYIPLAVQRNYTFNKAVQLELHIDPSNQKITGVELQHKWRF